MPFDVENLAIVAELRESRRRLATLMDNLPGMAYRCKNDPGWTMEFVSQGCHPLTGYPPADLIDSAKMSYAALIHPDDLQGVWDAVQASLARGAPFQITYRIRTASGAEKWVWEQGQGVAGADGALIALEGFILDITGRKRAEEALYESEARFRGLYENATVGMYRTTPQGRILMANPTLVRMLGYQTFNELAGRDLAREGYEPAYPRQQFQDAIEREGQIIGLEAAWKRRDGSIIFVRESARVVRAPDGRPLYYEGTVENVTSRHEAEEALRRNEALLETAGRVARFGGWRVDLVGRREIWSDQVAEIHGMPAGYSPTLGQARNYYAPEYRDRIGRAFEACARDGTPYDEELEIITARGHRVWVRTIGEAVRDASGAIVGLQGALQDINDYKRSEARIRFQASLLNAVGQAIIATDQAGRIIYFNRAAEALYGWPAEEALGRPVMEVTVPDISRDQGAEILAALARGEAWSGEFTVQRRDGTIFSALVSDSPLLDEAGAPIGAVGISTDVSDLKQVQAELQTYSGRLEAEVEARTRELRAAQDQLMRREKLAVLGQLAGSVGHELRNPLAVIHNAVYYLNLIQPRAEAKVQEYLGIISRECNNATGIINDLLDFARLKSVQQEPVAVPGLVHEVLEHFPAPEAVRVSLDLPPDLPAVCADPRQVGQVLGNLISNAYQAMPQGGTLAIRARVCTDGPDWVAISVQDTGAGIAPENLALIFEPLFTTKARGVGLGLAISKKLIEANDGRIDVASELGVGSVFTVCLRADRQQPQPGLSGASQDPTERGAHD